MPYKELATKKPFVVNKNLGSALEVEPEELTQTNADGLEVINLTQKQKYDFDRKGWLLVPSILSQEEITLMSGFCQQLHANPDSIPDPQRCGLGGPLQSLADHPVVVGFLNEFLAYPPVASEDCYGFRLEESEVIVSNEVNTNESEYTQNKGNGLFRLPGDSHIYRCVPGRGWSGLTRAIWDLSETTHASNNLQFITGSHKSAYQIPAKMYEETNSLWESYECPAGSVVFITESLTQKKVDTLSNPFRISNLYNTVASRWSSWLPHTELLEAMPAKRRTLFRDAYAGGNVVNGDFGNRTSAFPLEI